MPVTRDRYRECGTTLNPAIGFTFLHGTDEQSVTTTPVALTWSKVTFNSTGLSTTVGSTRTYVKRGGGGMYMIYAQCGIERAQGVAATSTLSLYINGSLVDCSTTHGMMGAKEHSDLTLILPRYLEVGDYVELYVTVDAGTGCIEANTARCTMMEVPMFGWDNDKGGRKMFRGKVMR